MALPSIKERLHPILISRLTTLILIYSALLSFNTYYIHSIESGIGIYSGLFHVTSISQLFDTFILIIASIILIALQMPLTNNKTLKASQAHQLGGTRGGMEETVSYAGEYSLIILFSTLGSTLLISSFDLITMYLSIELQSFGVYILATLFRYSESASNAGLKYFLLGGLSSCIILLGAGLIYTFTGLTNLESIYSLISVADTTNLTEGAGYILGFILIIAGFLFKIAAAPLHNWAPDVYDDSPTIVTIWLTIMPKIAILIFLLELITQATPSITLMNQLPIDQIGGNITYIVKNLLLISSLLSLIIGTVVGLAQSRIKRLLAYSTISHVGFILLALAINTEQSIESLLFYIMQYSITNFTTFLIIIALGYMMHNTVQNSNKMIEKSNAYAGKDSSTDIGLIAELKGQFYSNPLLSLSLSICLFSMAGIPPLIGFFSKQFVLYSAIQSGYYFMAIVAIIVSVISASYYLKIIRLLHSEADVNLINSDKNIVTNEAIGDNVQSDIITNFHSFLISTLTLTILLFVLKPSLILNSTQLLSLSLYNF
jgi:NADH-ubiquinone oxidoreductase chain 2